MIGIITDSTCDIPEDLQKQYGILVVPTIVIWGDGQYADRVDLTPEEFYRRIEKDPVLPHSSMPDRQAFQSAYDCAIQQSADSILVVMVSSAMSGTYQQAKLVAKDYSIPIEVVDAKGPTMSVGWQVLAAARARDAGADMKSILETVERVRGKLVQLVGMDTLKYLQTGGRIGNAAKWAGTLLQVKPLVSINHNTGLVEPVGIPRTHHALVEMMYRKFFDQVGDGKNLRVAVLHGNALEEAQALAERIRQEYHPLELLINMTGPVLGINTGPGAFALCGYAED
jgi:DegV family protein with EDD domain